MSADTFLQNLTDALFVLIFFLVLVRTVRRPHRANVDASLLFGAVALIVVDAWVSEAFGGKQPGVVNFAIEVLLMALPYLLLRLVDDYAGVSTRLMRAAGGGLAASGVADRSGGRAGCAHAGGDRGRRSAGGVGVRRAGSPRDAARALPATPRCRSRPDPSSP